MSQLKTDPQPEARWPRWLHYYAVLAACATFPLLLVGGLVTTYDVGMAVPDWPTTKGYNMFTYPWLKDAHEAWGVFVEHSHRLLGALVGMLTIVLTVWLWVRDKRSWLRWLGAAALAGVILQGVLGGLRVVRVDRTMAVLHGVIAQGFFVLMVCLAVFTSKSWSRAVATTATADAGRLRRLALLTTGLVFVQLVFGAVLRHLGVQWVLFAHLFVALAIVVHAGLLAKRVFVGFSERRELTRPVEIIGVLVVVQLMLGAAAWATSSGFGPSATMAVATRAHVFSATSHVGVGALILAACAILTIECFRCLSPVPVEQSRRSSSDSMSTAARAKPPARTALGVSSLEPRDILMVEGSV